MNKLTLKVSEIKNNPNNPRLIKDDKFKKLVKSLKELPIMLEKRPVIIDENNVIIGGNMRHKAAKEAGLKELPVETFTRDDAERNNIEAKKLNPDYIDKSYEDQVKEMVIKDNVSGGDWDWDMLANEWDAEELDEWGLDTPDDWGEDKEVEEDEAPEVDESEPPKSKLGEIYQLGRHRVMCGDSTDFGSVSELMDGKEVGLVHTDPPYGVSMNRSLVSGKDNSIQNDDLSHDKLQALINEAFVNCLAVAPDASMYWWIGFRAYSLMESVFEGNGVKPTNCIVWVKPSIGLGMTGYRYRHELCIFSGKTQDKSQSDVWEFGRDNAGLHPTMKPIELVAYAIKNSSKRNDNVLDLFLSSGSTLIACEQTDRTCYGMELDPKYVDVIRKRYHKFVTGSEEGWEENTPAIKE